MAYTVKEIYLTLQGEGINAGRAAVFCRFAGCNLWSGREADRPSAVCNFCDTDFVGTDGEGGGRFETADALAQAISRIWGPAPTASHRLVVLTGGEPLLQVDEPLVNALHALGLEIAVETNGTQPAPAGLDWICVSPKAGAPVVLRSGDELKLVFPQAGLSPQDFEGFDFRHFLLQPMDGPQQAQHTALAVAYCRTHPRWRLSVQTHKLLGLP
ncbi:MAG: 7-carboxy-7-deazaguanine synthase [Betaproteobacteria bacterium]|nr:7-carboxy-7-deazaguanine synthase [Betaproteobacteria bacterium]